tara:strand:- start:490 stop:759 length:270 start_codon:yes stop_codon:yes gene_type:complete
MAFKLTNKNKEMLQYFAVAVIAYFVWKHFVQNKRPSSIIEGYDEAEMTTCILDALRAKTTSNDPTDERANLILECARNIGTGTGTGPGH